MSKHSYREVPFSNGTHFDVWYDGNCCECRHFKNCAIENGLAISMATRQIKEKLFDRAGGFVSEEDGCTLIPCKEKNRYKGTKRKSNKPKDTDNLFTELLTEAGVER